MTTRAAALAVVTRDLIDKVANDPRYQCLIEEPFSAIEHFVSGNVLVSLRTGFGKSLIYGLLVYSIALEDRQEQSRFRLFVMPLTFLMIDQKARFLLRAEFLGDIQHDVHALQHAKEDVEQNWYFDLRKPVILNGNMGNTSSRSVSKLSKSQINITRLIVTLYGC